MTMAMAVRGVRAVRPARVCSLLAANNREIHAPSLSRLGVTLHAHAHEVGFRHVVHGVECFQKVHGHFAIPAGYRIPKELKNDVASEGKRDGAQWPAELRGYPLGFKLKALLTNPKHREANEDLLEELRAMGFPADEDWRAYLWEKSTLKGLYTYRELHGHLLVPRNFVVPTGDSRWPPETWGLRLGLKVMNMRQDRYYLQASEMEDLKRLDFVWDVREHVWQNEILPALREYHKVFGHCAVDFNFVVPAKAPWPPQTWSMRLGVVVHTVRSVLSAYERQAQRDREILDELGFVWNVHSDRWSREVLPAMETYSKLHHGELPPIDFVVPYEDPWPVESWGLNLGSCVMNMRYNGNYRRKVQRDAQRLRDIGWLEYLTARWDEPLSGEGAS